MMLDGAEGKTITVPDGTDMYEVPNTGLAIAFDPGVCGFKEGDTFSFFTTAPAATNGEVLAPLTKSLT
jgi:hypothetical protein